MSSFDRLVGNATEGLARRLSRRQVMFRGMKGVAGATAAIAVGSLAGAKNAFAVTCTCGYACGQACSGCPSNGGCPTSYAICTSPCAYGNCPWSTGEWVSCTGCGQGSGSYRVCTDCRLIGHSCKCPEVCTCLSGCLCLGCGSPSEMQADMAARGIVVGPRSQ